MFLFVLLVLACLGFYVMTPEERARLSQRVAALVRWTLGVARSRHVRGDDLFYVELRTRVRWPLVTYALAAASVAMLALGLVGTGALDDPATLVAWGGNFGPRTTDGERWRVFTSIFVHRGVLHLIVNMAALVQLGLILERVVGPFTFGTVFLAAGALGSIASGTDSPMSVFVGATGAVFGLYGLLIAAVLRGLLQRSTVRIPLAVLARMAPMAAVFVLYCLATGEPSTTGQVGLCTGLVGGIALTRSVRDHGARLRRFAALGAATAAIVLMAAMAVRAVTDIRPEIAQVVANEERIAGAYDAAVLQFRNGRMTARQLAQVIDETIVPSLEDARARVSALVDVPAAEAAFVADMEEYLRLRDESWRVRARALRHGGMQALQEADRIERTSLQLFERLRAAAAR